MRRSLIRSLLGFSVGLLAIFSFSSTALAIDEFAAPGSPSGAHRRTGRRTSGSPRRPGTAIGRMTPGGVVTNEIPIPTAGSLPSEITVGPDGLLWFTEFNARTRSGGSPANRAPSASSRRARQPGRHRRRARRRALVRTVRLQPGRPHRRHSAASRLRTRVASEPGDITVGPDSRLWFTEGAGNRDRRHQYRRAELHRLSRSLDARRAIPPASPPPGRALWFTEFAGNKIGRISDHRRRSPSSRRER